MPPILSKHLANRLLGSEWSFGYNCYEVGHTWTPSCTHAALEVSTAAGLKVVPLYAALYLFSQLAIQQKYDTEASWDTFKSIGRSSFFIFFHAYNGSMLGCALRRGFGRFYYRVLVCLPALLSSYLSLLIEKPARRQALAFYLLNLASEILYRMAVTKGYFRPLKHGETFLFALSLSAWYHLIKTHGFGHDPVSAAFKLLIGRVEAKSRSRLINCKPEDTQSIEQTISTTTREKRLNISPEAIQKKLTELLDQVCVKCFGSRHGDCRHTEASCLCYVIAPLPSRFVLGYSIQALLRLAGKPLQLFQSPRATLLDTLFGSGVSSNLRFGLFIASLVSGSRLTSCLLRHYCDGERKWHASVAGFVAGSSMLWAPRSSIAMYVMWKAIEQFFLISMKRGTAFDVSILSIYSASAATILYAFALEPQFVRPSYMKFLDNLSDHRLHQLNRMVLDVFGTQSSKGYEDFFPDLHPKYMSNQFKELIFNWMIQPYE